MMVMIRQVYTEAKPPYWSYVNCNEAWAVFDPEEWRDLMDRQMVCALGEMQAWANENIEMVGGQNEIVCMKKDMEQSHVGVMND